MKYILLLSLVFPLNIYSHETVSPRIVQRREIPEELRLKWKMRCFRQN